MEKKPKTCYTNIMMNGNRGQVTHYFSPIFFVKNCYELMFKQTPEFLNLGLAMVVF